MYSMIFFEDFCFVMKMTSCRSTGTAREPGSLNSNSIIQWAFSLANLFFKSILSSKSWRGRVEVFVLKNGAIDGYPY